MEMDAHGVLSNGEMDVQNENAAGSSTQNPPQRVLTVDQALPLTTYTSVVPFNSDIVPFPSVGRNPSASLFATPEERARGRQHLDSLNKEATANPGNTSQRLQQTLEDLKELLKPHGLTHFKFKHLPKLPNEAAMVEPAGVSLSPVARKVLELTSSKLKYQSSKYLSSKPTNGKAQHTIQKSPIGHPSEGHLPPLIHSPKKHISTPKTDGRLSASNIEAVSHNSNLSVQPSLAQPKAPIATPRQPSTPIKPSSRFQIVIPSLPDDFPHEEYATPSKKLSKSDIKTTVESPTLAISHLPKSSVKDQTHTGLHSETTPSRSISTATARASAPDSDSSPGLAIVIPDLPCAFNPRDYETVPDLTDIPNHLSRKRKRSQIDGENDGSFMSIDQREKADIASRNLRYYLQQIFEAEEQMHPENCSSNSLFVPTTEGFTLGPVANYKVEDLITKMILARRFAEAPVEDLLRLQNLVLGGLRDGETVDIKVHGSMGESEVESWLQQSFVADLGLKAARTSLRLMSGHREENQIYSEDVLQATLNVFRNVMDNCIIPVVEMRSTGSAAVAFKLLLAQKKVIANILIQCRKVLSRLAVIVADVELSETMVNLIEFTASRLIFVENAAIERDSLLGIAKFDSLRVVAMSVLEQVFVCHPAQRPGILDEILVSLEKLPVTKQSARQYMLAEGDRIQLVSALIMRLIQSSAGKPNDAKERRRLKALEALNGDGADGMKVAGHSDQTFTIKSESMAKQQPEIAVAELRDIVSPLDGAVKKNSLHVVNFLVERAMKSTKTGDTPYRNLLDLFVEDFITCLGSIDWPAAEYLLNRFLVKMVTLLSGSKTPAPTKNTALDLLGTMGAAIAKVSSGVRKSANSREAEDELTLYLANQAHETLENRGGAMDMTAWGASPLRVSLESLNRSVDSRNNSSAGFLVYEWAERLLEALDHRKDHEYSTHNEGDIGKLSYRLRMMIGDRQWLSTEYNYDSISPSNTRLAYSLVSLKSHFCREFKRILSILVDSMQSEQATVRSKSLKSIIQVLETDRTILDQYPAVMQHVQKCSSDPSVLVRDSALTLLGKFIQWRPAMQEQFAPSILELFEDESGVVCKRAMKLSKDIYLNDTGRGVRSVIAQAVLHQVTNKEESVRDLACQIIEDIWMVPFHGYEDIDKTSAKFKLAMADHVTLIAKTIQRDGRIANVLDKVLQSMLSKTSKHCSKNFRVCKYLVATMFEIIIDNSSTEAETVSAGEALQALRIFAKANADLFTPEQIEQLEPYISNVNTAEDISIFHHVVVIFRHVLPKLSRDHLNFLVKVRGKLLPTLTRMGQKSAIDDIVACAWIISGVIGDIKNLTTMTCSILLHIDSLKRREMKDLDSQALRKLSRMIAIGGICGKHCNFDPELAAFKFKFPAFKDNSVSKLMVDTIAPFSQPNVPTDTRKEALEAIGMICQSWPRNFQSPNIYTTFQTVFQEKDLVLEAVVLKALKEFLIMAEDRPEAESGGAPGVDADPTKSLGVMGGGQGDGIPNFIARQFLEDIRRICLASSDSQALLATEVLASIARQGLCHPKECGVTFIALETSPNPQIAEIAAREHRALHETHEQKLEKEYMRAVEIAYKYQRDVVGDTHGATEKPFAAKLHLMIDILKISKVSNRKKLFENLCSRINFDPVKMSMEQLPHHLDFSQFIIENLAFFDYASVDELRATIRKMELVVSTSGVGIADLIETEIFPVVLQNSTEASENGQLQSTQPAIDRERLTILAGASMMLSILWGARTFLRRLYGQSKDKAVPKDLNRAPVKVPFVTGDKFWEENSSIMASFESEESMMKQCRSFVELMTIDEDVKVAAEGDEEVSRVRHSTPSEGEEDEAEPTSGGGRGRKRKAAGTPGGRKKRARSSSVALGRGRLKGAGKRLSLEQSDDDI
ncbi:hypothetical protein BJ875DRAFT_498949 [Amylocarpus encephaloides]|uniref:Sister chromatid cohesion protein n=1 Tax=Amylocarpus encephaloides TaxID=45428 RepID=A0A9P8C1T8_9HELO|nr:hypothetical protein BJ875DRAFT_498949 [Amylocarpus encephaloides]